VALYEDARRIILGLDNDQAGDRAAGQLATLWPQAKRLTFPAEVGDLNDWWRSDKKELTGRLQEMAA
jgi:hypothetical protein